MSCMMSCVITIILQTVCLPKECRLCRTNSTADWLMTMCRTINFTLRQGVQQDNVDIIRYLHALSLSCSDIILSS